MPRYKLLATISDVVLSVTAQPGTPGPVAPVGKPDVEVAFVRYTPEGVFSFDVPAYDPATHNAPNAIHVSLFERKPDGSPLVAVPVDLAEAVAGGLHYTVDATGSQAGRMLDVDATDAPEGKYVALAVLEFAD